ncbi:MAG: MASE1 domain-containing protein, partial [Pseudomonadota bacterium]|nr:MASE1 domain-containing protein [Pseudomonadota bacterium]
MKISAVLRHLCLIITWLVLWRLSVFTEYAPHASIWFPPAGFTFTCFLLLRWQALPAMFIACVLSTGWESLVYNDRRSLEQLLIAGSHFALLHCLVYGVSANLLRGSIDRISHHNLY